jgi:histone H3/H4
MSDTKALIQQIRSQINYGTIGWSDKANQALIAAADALESQAKQIQDWDRILRSSVPEQHKDCTSPVGAVQNYIAELEEQIQELTKDAERLAVESLKTSLAGSDVPLAYRAEIIGQFCNEWSKSIDVAMQKDRSQ